VSKPAAASTPSPTRIDEMTPEGRRLAFDRGELRRGEVLAWAARHPEEVPLINDEFPWIAATLADFD
jgi:hypothetical protein